MKKVETGNGIEEREDRENKQELLEFINENPGATLNELRDIWNGLDGYDFMQTMLTLFDEYKVVEDIGHHFTDEATRQKTSY